MWPSSGLVIRWVTGLLASNATPALASASVTVLMSRNRTDTVGRPNSMVKPASPTATRWVTSFVLTSSVPRPWMPVDSCGTSGSLKARRTMRGQLSSCGSIAAVGQTSGSGSNRTPSPLEDLPDGADEGRVQVLRRHPAVAGVAFDAAVEVDDCSFDRRVDVDRAHRTDGDAVAAGDAAIGRYMHGPPPLRKEKVEYIKALARSPRLRENWGLL